MDDAILEQITLSVAAAQSLDKTLRLIVDGLTTMSGTVLARVWLKRKGDECSRCKLSTKCTDRSTCLHLTASAGRSIKQTGPMWTTLESSFRRFPVGVYKVGRIAETGVGEYLGHPDGLHRCDWVANSQWAREEQIRSFAGQPLIYNGETLGVLAIFTREPMSQSDLRCLRTFANHAAVAIANAHYFDEIKVLRRKLELECSYLREQNEAKQSCRTIIGKSESLRIPLEHVSKVAPTDANVLIYGESGTGKELFAQALYEQSQRRKQIMVKVNCAAIPRELFESEFFGHKKGSFTGASSDRVGRFEVAHQGTLFLDEVGEIPLELQGKLLRVLQEGQFERVGEAKTRSVDVRVIAATNRDLKQMAQQGLFRQDLYYRLSTFPINLPPLRERLQDIEYLARYFVELSNARFDSNAPFVTEEQVRLLQSYSWPGNIRELQSVIERAVILSNGYNLPIEAAFPEILAAANSSSEQYSEPDLSNDDSAACGIFVADKVMRDRERRNVLAALEHARWKISGPGGAASLLGIKPTTLTSRMRSMGIQKRR